MAKGSFMNIFLTNSDPKQCARELDDKRVNKMILETAQMLSTALQTINPKIFEKVGLYKPTHANHPANLWIRETRSNYLWALKYMQELLKIKFLATGKGHKSSDLIPLFKKYSFIIPEGELTPFTNCAANKTVGLDYKDLEVHEAYKKYLNERWKLDKIPPTWKNRKEPKWKEC